MAPGDSGFKVQGRDDFQCFTNWSVITTTSGGWSRGLRRRHRQRLPCRPRRPVPRRRVEAANRSRSSRSSSSSIRTAWSRTTTRSGSPGQYRMASTGSRSPISAAGRRTSRSGRPARTWSSQRCFRASRRGRKLRRLLREDRQLRHHPLRAGDGRHESRLTFRCLREVGSGSVFKFHDTLTSRAGIRRLRGPSWKTTSSRSSASAALARCSYLDFLSRARVKEIRGFDRDGFHVHNAFRAPGRTDPKGVRQAQSKSVMKRRYGNFRHGP